MFDAIVSLKSIGKFSTFKEAFKAIYDEINRRLSKNLTWQELETTVWIQLDSQTPVYFYDARDKMCEEGFLLNGKWVG